MEFLVVIEIGFFAFLLGMKLFYFIEMLYQSRVEHLRSKNQ